MTARLALLLPLALAASLVLAAACGGDDGGQRPPGRLTDPRSVPTARPWTEPPEPIILGPDILTPISHDDGTQENDGGTGDGGAATGECGDTYTVQAGDVPFTIAEKCGVDLNELLELNGIDDPTTLRVGQELKIPQ